MLECTEMITIVHWNDEAQNYDCTNISGCSWYAQDARTLYDRDVSRNMKTTVRIPATAVPKNGLTVAKGDIVCRGAVGAVNRRQELEQYERFEITEIRRNLRGYMPLQHIALVGA